MKAKEEIIKKAYGVWYTSNIDENGWTEVMNIRNIGDDVLLDLKTIKHDGIPHDYARPKSLKGIENNNGWTKMNDKRDNLPDEHCKCWLWTDDGIMFGEYNSTTKGFYGYKEVKFSHYLVIQEPKPPLF